MKNLLTFLSGCFLITSLSAQDSPEGLAQAQLEAYNARDIEAFLIPYSDSVKIYNFPQKLSMNGKEAMRQTYSGMFDKLPDLHCELMDRLVMGNTVIDHERVTFEKGKEPMQVFAMYKVRDGKIAEVYFIRDN